MGKQKKQKKFARHVILPPELASKVPQSHLLTETEWRNLGLQQSTGWIHYMMHKPGILVFVEALFMISLCKLLHFFVIFLEPHVLLFRRAKTHPGPSDFGMHMN